MSRDYTSRIDTDLMPQPVRTSILAALPLAVVLLVAGAILFIAGVLFAMSPASLGEYGFMPNPEAWRRVVGLLFFGGIGAAFLVLGYGLLRLWPFVWRRFVTGAIALGAGAVAGIWKSPEIWFGWFVLLGCVSSLVLYYLAQRSER